MHDHACVHTQTHTCKGTHVHAHIYTQKLGWRGRKKKIRQDEDLRNKHKSSAPITPCDEDRNSKWLIRSGRSLCPLQQTILRSWPCLWPQLCRVEETELPSADCWVGGAAAEPATLCIWQWRPGSPHQQVLPSDSGIHQLVPVLMIQRGQQNKVARGKETITDKTPETSTIMPKLGIFLEEKKNQNTRQGDSEWTFRFEGKTQKERKMINCPGSKLRK